MADVFTDESVRLAVGLDGWILDIARDKWAVDEEMTMDEISKVYTEFIAKHWHLHRSAAMTILPFFSNPEHTREPISPQPPVTKTVAIVYSVLSLLYCMPRAPHALLHTTLL